MVGPVRPVMAAPAAAAALHAHLAFFMASGVLDTVHASNFTQAQVLFGAL